MSKDHSHDSSDRSTDALIELQQQLSFQQHAYDDLHRVVLQQQAELEDLRRMVQTLQAALGRVIEGGAGEDLPHDKPPHY